MLQCGIVGLPNVGKSTLFNALSNAKAQVANFPFCTIEPNIGVIQVPDERLVTLGDIVKPQKIVPTTIEIVDIAGLVKGASRGEGLGNQFLAAIRNTDAIIHVVRCFEDPNVTHLDGSVDSVRDKEVIDMELQLADLETIDRKIEKSQKVVKSGDKNAQKFLDILEIYKKHLQSGQSARTASVGEVKELNLLTNKPVLYVCNVDEKAVKEGNKQVEQLKEAIKDAEVLVICAVLEAEIAQLDDFNDRQQFLAEMGLEESGASRLIKAAYKLLNLITYYTAGEKEVRGWTIPKGLMAPQAAGIIHTDFEKGFIKAEVIKYDDYVSLGSELACKEAGKVHLEGKDYLVKDGDVIYFRFNV